MSYLHIAIEKNSGIEKIILNAPKTLNSICMSMYDEILDAFKKAEKDSDVKVIILCAEGPSFCGGGDIVDMQRNIDTYGNARFDFMALKAATISMTILKMKKPVIAAVQGAVAGAAFNILLACDIVVCSEDARFIQAFKQIGLVPDAGGVYLLSRAVGTSKAKELCFSARPVSSTEAKALGIVAEIYSREELISRANEMAEKLAQGPASAFAKIKELMYRAVYNDFEWYIPFEVKAQVEMGRTQFFKEGLRAFLGRKSDEGRKKDV